MNISIAALSTWVLLANADGGAPAREKPAAPTMPAAPPSLLLAPPSLLAPVAGGLRAGPTTATADQPLLRPAKDGSGDLLYDAPGFSARVAPDGGVTFKDKRLSALDWLPLLPGAAPRNVPSAQATVSGLLRDGRAPVADDARPNDGFILPIPMLTPFRPAPREGCRACDIPLDVMPGNITGRFDLSDEVARLSSRDPRRYEKARFLTATRELRVRKAVERHAENIKQAAHELPGRVLEIACDDRRSRRERRQILEQLRAELDGVTEEAQAAARLITQALAAHFGPTASGHGCPVSPKPDPG